MSQLILFTSAFCFLFFPFCWLARIATAIILCASIALMGSDRWSLAIICHCPLPSDALGWKELSEGILPVGLRMHPANTENWLLPKDATCRSCGFDIYYGRKTVWPVNSGWYCKGQAAHSRGMDMGFLSGTGSCPDGCGRENVVTSPLIKEAQGLLWYVPQQVVWVAEEMGLVLIAQAPTCPVC